MSDILSLDKAHCWHPFTQHRHEREPIVLRSAKGSCLYDEQGKRYLDLVSSWWTCLHGHRHPALLEALQKQAEQMGHVMFSGFTHEPAARLAADIANLLPGDLSRIFFSDNGSTAVEVALKIAYQFWQNRGETERNLFVSFKGGYHGDTLGAMSAGQGSGFFNLYSNLMCRFESLDFARTWTGDDRVEEREQAALAALDRMIATHPGKIAALVVEPMLQGAGGMNICRPEFMTGIVQRARAAGILVIFDEVATGFGRTGKMFAADYLPDGAPDMVCLSKGLTGGLLPLSLTVVRETIFQQFLGDSFQKALAHGHSFTANPLACAVARRSLQLFHEENLLEGAIRNISNFHRQMHNKLADHPMITKVRQLGTILAFDLAGQEAGYKSDASLFLRDWYLKHGLNIRPLGPVVYLWPPFSMQDHELEEAYDGLFAGLEALSRHLSD